MTTTFSARGAAPETARPYIEQFDRLQGELPGAGLAWLAELRRQGRDRFAEIGFPTVRNETWKYTNLRALDKLSFEPASPTPRAGIDTLPTVRPAGAQGPRLVFIDGRFHAELSSTAGLPEGVELLSLADALRTKPDFVAEHLGRLAQPDDLPLVALNTAFLTDGPLLHVPQGVAVEQPVEIVHVTLAGDRPSAVHPRTLIVAGTGARVTVVEHHVGFGTGADLANHVAEVFVADEATVRHYKVQREGTESFHFSHAAATVGTNGHYDNFILTTGARLSRNEVRSTLAGTDSSTHVSGAYMVRGGQHCDTSTFIDHAQPNGTSREVYKGAIDDTARAVFQGKILVRPGAQKTDGYQINRALLLSDNAEIDSKPELEIYADDVKCSHGATIGELDEDALFYMRARGIEKDQARSLLIGAFLAEAIEEIADETVREAFQEIASGWMASR
ncbi:Fe-S cluster assembly protein SufD [Azospirillum sp. SYSU D00513]|uniref:Fe-S cluster assembly protein SufD n=1 Tax=Azospirillum sp. SYSU D00513 TaxID=2812561 RepID=UPI001A962584|nr:Fe-S cluster assembly protein SufD [Azospirillum sp. SYSU D00513]